jgi:hypothetical protein
VTGVPVTDTLNVRAVASPRGTLLARVPPGGRVRATGQRRRFLRSLWCEVVYGRWRGWVNARYLMPDDAELPTAAPMSGIERAAVQTSRGEPSPPAPPAESSPATVAVAPPPSEATPAENPDHQPPAVVATAAEPPSADAVLSTRPRSATEAAPPAGPENAPPASEPASRPKKYDVGGTIRSLTAAIQPVAYPRSPQGTTLDQVRVTMKATPIEGLTLEAHVVQAFMLSSVPATFDNNDFGPFGPNPYRALDMTKMWASSATTGAIATVDRLSAKLAFSRFDITVGRQPINFAKSYFWSPLDVFLPFTPQTIDREYKAGVDALRVDIPVTDDSGINLIAAAGARLHIDPQTANLGQGSVALETSALLLRTYTTLRNYDLALQAGSVYGGYHLGLGVAGDVMDLGVRGEASYLLARHDPPVTLNDPTGSPIDLHPFVNHLKLTFGIEHRFKNSLYYTLEYLYNGAVPGDGDALTPRLQIMLAETTNSSRHLVGGVVTYDVVPTFVVKVASILGIRPKVSALLGLSADYSVAENVDLSLGALIGVGPGTTESAPPAVSIPTSEFGGYPNLYYLLFKMYL